MTTRLSGTGIWSSTLRYGDAGEAAARGHRARGARLLGAVDPRRRRRPVRPRSPTCSAATTTATIATGILNVWMHTPEEAAAQHAALTAEHGPRFLCGIGISHRPFIDHVNDARRLPEAGRNDGGLPRRPRRRGAAAGRGRPRARRARAEDAGARPHPHGRHPPLPRHPRAHGEGRERASAPTASSPASRASCWTPIRTSARATARLHLKTYLGAAELLEQLEAPGLHRRRPRRRRQRPSRRRPRRVG